jgi:hypothetical protein
MPVTIAAANLGQISASTHERSVLPQWSCFSGPLVVSLTVSVPAMLGSNKIKIAGRVDLYEKKSG